VVPSLFKYKDLPLNPKKFADPHMVIIVISGSVI
jgi:hypothetical protein